jgi:hypothetical protein
MKELNSQLTPPKPNIRECSNCGARLARQHAYCPQCGQANRDLNVPLHHLIEETVEGIFHFDKKSFKTIWALAFKPGFVTSEFVRGKRASYVAPMKLYVFISFLFFLLLSASSGSNEVVPSADADSTSIDITFFDMHSKELRNMHQTQLDSVMQSRGITQSGLNRYMVRQLSRVSSEGQKGFNHLLVKSISYMMFALMPLFALFIYLLNRKKAKYYISTLIFSIHYHSFIFLLLTASLVVDWIADIGLIIFVPLVICPVYLYLALRSMYRETRMKTIGKTLAIGVFQAVAMAALFLVTVFVSILIF